jgi:hypothetical protein
LATSPTAATSPRATWQSYSRSDTPKTPLSPWRLTVHYRVHKSSPLDSTSNLMNIGNIFTLHLISILILSPRLGTGFPRGLFPTDVPINLSHAFSGVHLTLPQFITLTTTFHYEDPSASRPCDGHGGWEFDVESSASLLTFWGQHSLHIMSKGKQQAHHHHQAVYISLVIGLCSISQATQNKVVRRHIPRTAARTSNLSL